VRDWLILEASSVSYGKATSYLPVIDLLKGYRLTRPAESLRVPTTVQTMLASRIDRLSPDDKQLLQAASVIGKQVPYTLLAAIAEQHDEALGRGLGHLVEAEFLYETQLFPDLEYTFKHALTHDVAYAGLLAERRRDLHAAVVSAIERLYPNRLAEHVERLAHHARQGELWRKAVAYLRQTGSKVFMRSVARQPAHSSKHSTHWGGCRRRKIPARSRSTSALNFAPRSYRLLSGDGWERFSTRPKPLRRRSETSAASAAP
jgi:predicted ATPase